jgi:hypothetical protein
MYLPAVPYYEQCYNYNKIYNQLNLFVNVYDNNMKRNELIPAVKHFRISESNGQKNHFKGSYSKR